MKKIVFNITLAATISLAALPSNAAIVEHGSYFTDTTDNLDWLNNTPLAGQSYNSVLGGFGGYTAAGWRIATTSELTSLVGNYVMPFAATSYPWTTSSDAPGTYDSAYSLIELLGINVAFGSPPDPRSTLGRYRTDLTGISTQGVYDDGDSSMVGVFNLSAYTYPGTTTSPTALVQISPDSNYPDDFHGQNVSVMLVRTTAVTTAVPEPETYTMLLAGLGLIGFMVRRRKGCWRVASGIN